jgi:hypothetical protein
MFFFYNTECLFSFLTNNIDIESINTSICQHFNKQNNRTTHYNCYINVEMLLLNVMYTVRETRSEQVVSSVVRQTSVSAVDIVLAILTITPVAKQDGAYWNY